MRPAYALWLAPLAAVSCFLQPDDRRLAPIENIQVPAVLAASETLRVSFSYSFGGCETAVGVSSAIVTNGVTYSVIVSVPRDRNVNCPSILHVRQHAHNVPPSQRSDPFTLTFRQPSGVDSIRVVRTQ